MRNRMVDHHPLEDSRFGEVIFPEEQTTALDRRDNWTRFAERL
jgi:hypothetical protein